MRANYKGKLKNREVLLAFSTGIMEDILVGLQAQKKEIFTLEDITDVMKTIKENYEKDYSLLSM